MFDLQKAALAYAKVAEKILDDDVTFLNNNQEVIPIFVCFLYQSLEISLKHLGIESGLFTEQEVRDKKLRKNGHGIEEIANLVNEKLGADENYPVIMALTADLDGNGQISTIIHKMTFANELKQTRQSYQSRNLGYAQLAEGELALFNDLKAWVIAIKKVSENLPTSITVVSEWQKSSSNSKTFAIWYK